MFKREHHLRIAHVLQSLNAELLQQHQCLFGGGTAIILSCNEYRESVDIDFIISDSSGYRNLRLLLKENGLKAITRPGMPLTADRELRLDQYGIRTFLLVQDIQIKFEIVFEARISLDKPNDEQKICGVATLTPLDMATTKLLANSDRWSDDSVFSRDLIDLAMLGLNPTEFQLALTKARSAYGDTVTRDLLKAITTLQHRKGRLDECMSALKMEAIPKALLWKNIRSLRAHTK